jgi:hypothetical protein
VPEKERCSGKMSTATSTAITLGCGRRSYFLYSRAAWTGSYAHAPEVPLRIEAASWRGRPVYFQVIGPWSKPERMAPPSGGTGKVFGMFFICTLILAAFLAWRNIRLGRGDTCGAFRLAAFVLSMSMLAWLCSASHVPTAHEFVSFYGSSERVFRLCRPSLDFLRSAGALR